MTTTTTQRPTWLVIVRFGGLLAIAGIVLSIIGSAVSFAVVQFGIYVLVAGGIVAALGVIYRLAKGRTT